MNKPLLRIAYNRFYMKMAEHLVATDIAPIVEVGSGIGHIRHIIPECICTDFAPNPWIDQVENAFQLSFEPQSVSNLLLLDVFHHLKFPGSALEEFHRVLISSGRLIILEPCLSMLGLIIYGCLHKEPLGLTKKIDWYAPSLSEALQQEYYAAQGNAFRIFVGGKGFRERLKGWRLVYVERIIGLSYLASGGYSGPQFFHEKCLNKLDAVDQFLQKLPLLFACRLLIILEKR